MRDRAEVVVVGAGIMGLSIAYHLAELGVRDVTVVDVFEGVGQHSAGNMSDAELHELECVACPGAGACGGQFTANTMATVMELIGLAPLYTRRVRTRVVLPVIRLEFLGSAWRRADTVFSGPPNAWAKLRLTSGNSTRSCGLLGPAIEGTTEAKSSSRLSE